MFPFIIWNEYIIVKKINPQQLKINDVILFNNGQKKVCHRLKKIFKKNKRLFFQTKGDHNKFFDQPIEEKKVLGKIIAIKRKMGLIKISSQSENLFYNLYIKTKDFLGRILK